MTTENHVFDLDGYVRRVGWKGDLTADVSVLRSLHRAHALSIPFENVDIFLLRSVPSLELPALEKKIVRGRRGGHCYEHNLLFAAALRGIGLGVTYLTGRVLAGLRVRLPRTHMLMLVEVPGEGIPYIADVGFGSQTALLEPVPLLEGVESVQDGRRFRLERRRRSGLSDVWVLQAVDGAAWVDQYEFTLEPFEEIDISVLNWHIATNPRSPARRDLYAGIARPDGHLTLMGRKVIRLTPDGTRIERELSSQEELDRLLTDEFAIDVPDGAHWPAWPARSVTSAHA